MPHTTLIREATDEELCRMLEPDDSGVYRAHTAAVAELYQRYSRRLLSFVSALVPHDEVEDFAQETWLKVCKSAPENFKGDRFCSWLFTVAKNCIVDNLRRKRPELIEDLRPVNDPKGRLPEDFLFDMERAAALERCLNELGEDEAAIIRARLRGDDYDEVCRRLSIQPTDAHRICHRAKLRLQKCVGAGAL